MSRVRYTVRVVVERETADDEGPWYVDDVIEIDDRILFAASTQYVASKAMDAVATREIRWLGNTKGPSR